MPFFKTSIIRLPDRLNVSKHICRQSPLQTLVMIPAQSVYWPSR